jgi:uncharacterized protein YeaO (DUF488 family)
MIKLKRVYKPALASDGCRVLVDRVWPRGVSKERAEVALWLKEIGPSTALRKWFGHAPERWSEFQKRYEQELRNKSDLLERIKQLEKEDGTVTLVFSARDEGRNQAVVLRDFLVTRDSRKNERRRAENSKQRRAPKKSERSRAHKHSRVRG